MNANIVETINLLRRELWERKYLFSALFLVISVLFLAVGWTWPKEYSSSSAILVDERNILRPLMEGTAVTTDAVDRAKRASEIIFSHDMMDMTLEKFGWLEGNPSEIEKERIASAIKARTTIANAGVNLIRITYEDTDPVRAFQMTEFFTEQFIERSIDAKRLESRSAYEFIDSQVAQYRDKLKNAEDALSQFRSQNLDASPGTESTVNLRIVELRQRIEATMLEVRETTIRRDTLRKQLSGEIAVTASLSDEGQYNQRLVALKSQLEELRLKYRDSYPDIVSIKGQIADIEAERNRLREARMSGETQTPINVLQSGDSAENTLYQQLRSQLSTTETELATLEARLAEMTELVHNAENRIIRINEVDAKLAELTRDYEANQDMYNRLVRQRDSANISMNIDAKNQGVTFKVQVPAALQLTPQGLRFAHFVFAGLVFSFLIPLGLLYGLTLLDQRVRSPSYLGETLGLPVLASVYHTGMPVGYTIRSFLKSPTFFVMLLCWAAYGYAVWLKLYGGV